MIEIAILPLPIAGLVSCCIPVLPGTATTEVPSEERTELCAVEASWIVGSAATCDTHMKVVCEKLDIDWPELLAEAGHDRANAERSWSERTRFSQHEARHHLSLFVDEARAEHAAAGVKPNVLADGERVDVTDPGVVPHEGGTPR